MAKLNNVEIHFKHSNRTYNTMTAFLVMFSQSYEVQNTPLVIYGLGGDTLRQIHICMKVFSRNRAHANLQLV